MKMVIPASYTPHMVVVRIQFTENNALQGILKCVNIKNYNYYKNPRERPFLLKYLCRS
jgi:hypothetical protein